MKKNNVNILELKKESISKLNNKIAIRGGNDTRTESNGICHEDNWWTNQTGDCP
ncbi:hypothetical protein U6A24_17050 [Aquimarina gracilis]|uniref:Natural product n=1 Tax=Aquimarina gracilis TaxID=874422 RepID=A0ABU5ZZ47_9FLAO|nr:hypothetical protein [Aquimarina gracilis]MEB3347185.1 hypothetical protein [Aquimarina gracilis]